MDSGLDQLKKFIATNKQANQQNMASPIASLVFFVFLDSFDMTGCGYCCSTVDLCYQSGVGPLSC